MEELIKVTKSSESWWTDNCYENVWLDHDIDENSCVVEFGGYQGNWVNKLSQKYDCNIYVFEPIPAFSENLKSMFAGPTFSNDKIKVFNFGVSLVTGKDVIYVSNDSTSTVKKVSDNAIYVDFVSVDEILEMTGQVDLCQMNIEGSEYDLLDYLISSGKINSIKRLMIEFHYERDEHFVNRRIEIQKGLIRSGYKCLWNYDWFFEYWVLS